MSIIATSPLMPGAYAWELQTKVAAGYQPSIGTGFACWDVARQTPDVRMPHLAIIEGPDASPRYIYTDYPDFEEWARLEQGCIIEGDNGNIYTIVDRQH